MTAPATYQVKLPQFEGPFDLLLFFIQRDELDIYDIPISSITNDFLDYLRQMEMLNIELASEFILVAATLMKIKSRMLLPRKEVDEMGQEIDPRTELVQRLLEYKRFKDVLGDLKALEDARQQKHERGNTAADFQRLSEKYGAEAELGSLTLFKLLKVFEKVMNRMEDKKKQVQHQITPYPYTVERQKSYLSGLLHGKKDVAFEKVFEVCENKVHAVFTFLALLDMIQSQLLKIKIGEGLNNFWVSSV